MLIVYFLIIFTSTKTERKLFHSLSGTGAFYYCAIHNPNEVSFRDQLINSALKILQVGEPIRNLDSVYYVKWLEQCYNEGIIRRINMGIISIIWLDNYDKCCSIYKSVCPYMKPEYFTFHRRIVDIGFLDTWWNLKNIMLNYDVNDLNSIKNQYFS